MCRFVLLEMYLCESGTVTKRFIEALVAAARRAVRRLLDAFGSPSALAPRFWPKYSEFSTITDA